MLFPHLLNKRIQARGHAFPGPPLPPAQERQHVRPDVFPAAHQTCLIHQMIEAVQFPRLVPIPHRRGAEPIRDVIREVRLHQVEKQEGSPSVALVGPQDGARPLENRLHSGLQPHLGGLQVLA